MGAHETSRRNGGGSQALPFPSDFSERQFEETVLNDVVCKGFRFAACGRIIDVWFERCVSKADFRKGSVMLRMFGNWIVACGLACGSALAAIPEPDSILYGGVSLTGDPVLQGDSVVVLARLGTGQEIGRYDFADCNADGVRDLCELSCSNPGCTGVPGCGTARDTSPTDGLLDDCPGHMYALRVRCESTPDGEPASGGAAILDFASPTVVQVLLQVNGQPAEQVRQLVISQRGKIQQVALSLLNLFTMGNFASCTGGPGASAPGGSCSAEEFLSADFDDDGDADLRDFAFFQDHFEGQ